MKFNFFIIGLSFIILFLRFLISIIQEFSMRMREFLTDCYLPELLKKHKRVVSLYVIKIASVAAGILFIYSMVRFTPFLPERYVPEDNLFDLGFYLDKFTEYIRSENNPDFPDSIYNICWETSLTYVLLLSFIALLQWIKVFRRILGFVKNKTFSGMKAAVKVPEAERNPGTPERYI